MNMTSKLAMSLVLAGVALGAVAEDRTFPKTVGDLASATDWDATVPGGTDRVKLNPGSYSFGSDVTFGNIYLSAAGTYSFTATGRAINLLTGSHQIDLFNARKSGVTANLTGGTWDFGGLEFRGMEGNGNFNLFGGAKIANAGNFYPKYYNSNSMSTLYLAGGSQIDCASFYASHKGGSITVNVTGGSKINLTGEFCTDSRNTEKTGISYWNYIYVRGEDSEINAGSLKIGLKQRDDIYFNINNGGKVTTTGDVIIGEGGGSRNLLQMDDGTLEVGGNLKLNYNGAPNHNNGIRAKNSTIHVAGDFLGGGNEGIGSYCDFQDTVLAVDGNFNAFQGYWDNGQTLRFGGENGTQPEGSKFKADPFGNANAGHNRLIIDDHFTFTLGDKWFRMMRDAHDCELVVTNYATFMAPAGLRFCDSGYATSSNNTLRIVDNSAVNVVGGFAFQVPNGGRMVVDGYSTISATGDIDIGNGGREYQVSISDSELMADGNFLIAYSGKLDNHNVVAITNTTISCSNVVFYGVNGGYTDLQNVTFNLCPEIGVWNPKSEGVAKGSIFDGNFDGATLRLGGSGNTPWGTAITNPFGGSDYATLIIDDGFAYYGDAYGKMLTDNHDCRLRISGGASYWSSSVVFIGHSDYTTSVSNTIEIVGGGSLTANQFFLMGTGNSLVISNGTLEAETDCGFGYSGPGAKNPTSGSRVRIEGEAPHVRCGGVWMCNGNELVIAIPAEGYEEPPISSGNGVVFHTNASLKLELDDYLAGDAGDVTLMSFGSDVTDKRASNNSAYSFSQWVAAQNAALDLPAGVPGLRLVRNGDGTDLVFRRKSSGLLLILK